MPSSDLLVPRYLSESVPLSRPAFDKAVSNQRVSEFLDMQKSVTQMIPLRVARDA